MGVRSTAAGTTVRVHATVGWARRLRPAIVKIPRMNALARQTQIHLLHANRAAFDRWRIVPRMLREVELPDTSVGLFGRRLPSPFLLAPSGVQELAHPEADAAVARAAGASGTPMILLRSVDELGLEALIPTQPLPV